MLQYALIIDFATYIQRGFKNIILYYYKNIFL